MAATVFMTLDGSTLVFADTIAGLTTPTQDASCQISSATVTTVANSSSRSGTMCTPAGDIVLASGATLDVEFFQDWSNPNGFCWFTDAHDAKEVAFRLTLGPAPTAPATAPKYEGLVSLRRASFGGASGDALTATDSYPTRSVLGTKPVPPAGTFEATDTDDDELVPA